MDREIWERFDDPAYMMRYVRDEIPHMDGYMVRSPYATTDRKRLLVAAAVIRDLDRYMENNGASGKHVTRTEKWAETGKRPKSIHQEQAVEQYLRQWFHWSSGSRMTKDRKDPRGFRRWEIRLCNIVREIITNPTTGPRLREDRTGSVWVVTEDRSLLLTMLPWVTPDVTNLAGTIYRGLCWDLLPLLADAVEEGGCDITEVIEHLRSGVTHYRGCWALDLILGKR